jgi:ferritin-like metal-binding protein YciE
MKISSLNELYCLQLGELHYSESHVLQGAPLLRESCLNRRLRDTVIRFTVETQGRLFRLEKVIHLLDINPHIHQSAAIDGFMLDLTRLLQADISPPILDSALVSIVQRISQSMIAAYGSVRTLAELLKHYNVADSLQLSLNELRDLNQTLMGLSERTLNKAVMTSARNESLLVPSLCDTK